MNAWQTQFLENLPPVLKAYRKLSLSAEFYACRSSMLIQCIHVVYAARADVVRGAATS